MGKHTKKAPSLSKLLENGATERGEHHDYDKEIEALQLRMLRAQQGIFHRRARAIIALEGFDAAGKGGAIRRLTEKLDPRGVKVHPIGPPEGDEQGKHWLYRFWAKLPAPGTIAIFDRTWYGRVLVERVDKLIDKESYERAYREIREFEAMLTNDGIEVVKIFVGISKQEQLKRFEDRLKDPYKRWKIGEPDIKARAKWGKYVSAADDLFAETHTKNAPWQLIAGDNKDYARAHVLKAVVERLHDSERWMEKEAAKDEPKDLAALVKQLKE
ncbi:MAG: polyphosphate kinase [Proteobacteria bacterium]|nr:MAG: polyphosphate kinase [Pseudomonadota bacterium]